MRKRIIEQGGVENGAPAEGWLDVERLAEAQITSEDPMHPIESALLERGTPGWRAAGPGPQILRLLFDQPVRLSQIRLVFAEPAEERTQELVLRWSSDRGRSYRDIVRQQYHFSPPGTVREVEEYRVDLAGVNALELRLVPDIGGGPAHASLEQLRLG